MSHALAKIRAAGFAVELEGDNLAIEPFSKLTADQLAYLKIHKPEIVQALRQEQAENGGITEGERQALQGWLDEIGEDDPELIEEFWEQVRADPKALAYFLGRAKGGAHG